MKRYAAILTSVIISLLHSVMCDQLLEGREDCHQNYAECSPAGASSQNEPAIGGAYSSFLVAMINTVNGARSSKRESPQNRGDLHARAMGGSLCCADGTQCLLLQTYDLPFCYDNYTTDYFLPGGSYGNIVSGNYTSPDGSTANLFTGNYMLAFGTVGNVYGSENSPLKPSSAALAIPSQYTASGSHSAIPITALGEQITYTTTVQGTTISPVTLYAASLVPLVSSSSTRSFMLSIPTTTISGTTITPQTSTVTTMSAMSSVTKKGAANVRIAENPLFIGVVNIGMVFIQAIA